MTVQLLFPTPFYSANLDDVALLADLDHSCRTLAHDDRAGRQWAKTHGYAGYTSYASLTDLPQRDPAFADLKRRLDRHVGAFAAAACLDLAGRKLRLDSLWVNVLKPGGCHSGHIHPHSAVSGNLRCGTVGIGGVETGGSAVAADDGGAGPHRRCTGGDAQFRLRRTGAGDGFPVGKLAAPRGNSEHGEVGADQHQLQLSLIKRSAPGPWRDRFRPLRWPANASPPRQRRWLRQPAATPLTP